MILFQSYRHTGASVNKLGPEGCVTEQVTVWLGFFSECSSLVVQDFFVILSPIQVQPQVHLTSYVLKAVALRGYSECSFWSRPKQVLGRNAGGRESV